MTTDRTGLLLSAALDPGEGGVRSWCELLDATPFEVIDPATTRLLPRLYLNLRTHGAAVPQLGRLKGAYRATWARNTVLISQVRPVLDALQRTGSRYRLLKGSALCAVADSWGARTMGDIDLLVEDAAAPDLGRAIRDAGYVPAYGASARAGADGAWVTRHGGVLDVTTSSDRGRDLRAAVLRAPAARGTAEGRPVAVPQPELMVLVAVAHASLAVAATDETQGLVDVAVLLPRCDPRRLRALASRLGWGPELALAITALQNTGAPLPAGVDSLATVTRGQRLSRLERRLATTARLAGRMRDVPRTMAERRLPDGDVEHARSHTPGRARDYAAWLATGQLRPLEAVLADRVGGFLDAPPTVLGIGDVVHAMAGGRTADSRRATVGPVGGSDLRVRIRIDPSALDGDGAVRLRVAAEPPDVSPRQLFANGRMHGSVPVLAGDPATITVPVRHGGVELSARSLRHGDPDSAFSALTVTVLPPLAG